MKDLFKKYTTIFLYAIIILILMYGAYKTSGTDHIGKIMIHLCAAIVFYGALMLIVDRKLKMPLKKLLSRFQLPDVLAKVLAILSVVQVLIHFIGLDGLPVVEAMSLASSEEISDLRNSITGSSSTLMNYISSINIRGALPFLILYFLLKKEYKFYWFILFVGVVYGFALMQKSYIVSILLPTLIYCSLKFKWWYILKHTAIIGLTVISLVYVSNPTPKAQVKPIETTKAFKSKLPLVNVFYGIQKRMFEVPGEIVSKWFDNIPANKPFLHGDGYHFYAKLRGRKHIDYASELYPIIRPNYAEQGYTGTVNTASFVYDYANFGTYGLILGGFLIALLMVFIEVIYGENLALKLGFNLFHISLLSSAAITTLAFSGGWMFLILFYLLFLRSNKTPG